MYLTYLLEFTAKKKGERHISVAMGASTERPDSYPPSVCFFSEGNKPTMDVTLSEEWGTGEPLYLMVAVKDTGIGIDEEGQANLFERFKQAYETTTPFPSPPSQTNRRLQDTKDTREVRRLWTGAIHQQKTMPTPRRRRRRLRQARRRLNLRFLLSRPPYRPTQAQWQRSRGRRTRRHLPLRNSIRRRRSPIPRIFNSTKPQG